MNWLACFPLVIPSLTVEILTTRMISAALGCWNQKASTMWMSGTSGGIWGLAEGYSLMIGGNAEVVEQVTPDL